MPISLSNLIEAKAEILKPSTLVETNLESGIIFAFTNGTQNTPMDRFCWCAAQAGVADIEIWGAGGSGTAGCCCSVGIPGNPGAYSRRTVTFSAAGHISGCIGMSCGNADTVNFRGCSLPTTITICGGTAGTCVCMCAEGGRSGVTLCTNGSSSFFCCFISACGLCNTSVGSGGCGFICNTSSTSFIPQAYGGVINRPGGVSCTFLGHCNQCCTCLHKNYVRTPAGVFSQEGGYIEAPLEMANHSSQSSFATIGYFGAIAALSKSPTTAAQYTQCWSGNRWCGCYEQTGCMPVLSLGMPGVGGWPCNDQRDFAVRGGHGVVRIKFLAS